MASKQKYVIHALRYAYPSSLACMDAAGSSEGEHVPKCEAVGGVLRLFRISISFCFAFTQTVRQSCLLIRVTFTGERL